MRCFVRREEDGRSAKSLPMFSGSECLLAMDRSARGTVNGIAGWRRTEIFEIRHTADEAGSVVMVT